jgi:hemerythrin-like domain-containing protein
VQLQGRRVADQMAELRDQLAMHFALEEAYGYFDDPIRVAPRLSVAASQLRDEHQVLYSLIRDLADEVDELCRAGTLAQNGARVVKRFGEYYDRLQQHENRESELILDAYDSDIGVGD